MGVTFAASSTGGFVGLVAGSFASAFLGGLLLLRVALALYRLLRGASPVAGAPPGSSEGISAEKRKEIDGLRAAAIRRYLQNYTAILDGDNTAVDELSRSSKPSAECCLASEDDLIDDAAETPEEADVELGNEKRADKCGEECISIPLLARDDCESRDDSDSSVGSVEPSTQPIHDKLKCVRGNNQRCAICHEAYQSSDRICWSSNAECTHAYHEECIVRWLVSLGWMKKVVPVLGEGKEGKKLLEYDLECPTCRREFVDKTLFEDADKRAEEKI
ncbi:hypothetical protein ACHAXT_001647 [Thalassiosira profunda]